MIKVKFKKNHKEYKKGEVVSFTNNEAFGLIDSGIATVSEAVTYQAKVVLPQLSKKYKIKGR